MSTPRQEAVEMAVILSCQVPDNFGLSEILTASVTTFADISRAINQQHTEEYSYVFILWFGMFFCQESPWYSMDAIQAKINSIDFIGVLVKISRVYHFQSQRIA